MHQIMITLAFALTATLSGLIAQDQKSDELIKAIKKHFETVTPELHRYGKVTFYGETLSKTAISKEELAREIALMKDATSLGKMTSPPDEVIALGHNLIVHDTTAGIAYLKTLHASADITEDRIRRAVVAGTVAAGEEGEASAVEQLKSKDKTRRAFWAKYLMHYAIYPSSLKPILKQIGEEPDQTTKASLIYCLCKIGSPEALKAVKELIENDTNDAVQSAAIFSFVEIAGYDGIAYLEKIKPVGEHSTKEKNGALDWLKKETSKDSKHGHAVTSDSEFVARFGDLKASPVIQWLKKEGLLEEEALKNSLKLPAEKQKELMALLLDSKGFGMEAVKGTVFRSLTKQDEAMLLKIRSASYYSPNNLSEGRLKTISIMIRHLRLEP